MAKNIKITQFASGSWTDNIGDTTLFYSAGYTRHASDVSGLFLDNPPVLSPSHASLVWRYNADVDQYILIHVQGSHVVNKALGRIYPFRAGYEVSRDDINRIECRLYGLLQAMPRIAHMPEGKVEAETAVEVRPMTATDASAHLASHVKAALLQGRPLYLAFDIDGEQYRGDGVFGGELPTLLAAIDSLPLTLRRYATFGFCVDEHFADVLGDVRIVIYDRASRMAIPQQAVAMTWQQALAQSARIGQREELMLRSIHLPGEHTPLLSTTQMQRAFAVSQMDVAQLGSADWTIWRMLGNDFSQLGTTGWRMFRDYHARMDGESQEAYARWAHDASLNWTMEGFHEDVFSLIHYTDDEVERLRRKALPGYLAEGRHGFLFGRGLSGEQKKGLDGQFLKSLGLDHGEAVVRWYDIFNRHGLLDNRGVMAAFGELFGQHVVPGLTSMTAIAECMEKYPFIPARYFKAPRRVSMPRSIDRLEPAYRDLIRSWVADAASAYSFDSYEQLMEAFSRVLGQKGGGQSPEGMALMQVKEGALFDFLTQGKAHQVVPRCEHLLQVAHELPKDWDEFVKDTVLPAVQHALCGGKRGETYQPPFGKDYLLDVAHWPQTAEVRRQYPWVWRVLRERLAALFEMASAKSLRSGIKDHFINATSLKNEKKANADGAKPVKYKGNAEEAYPIISLYISTIKKSDKNMSKELDHLFRDLRGKRNKGRMRLIAWIGTAIICAVGGLLAGKWLFAGEKPQPDSGMAIVWNGNRQANLMQQLASLAEWDSVSLVKVDTLRVPHLKLDKTASLRPLNQAYYRQGGIEVADTALVRAYLFNEKGQPEGKIDSLTITTEHPLLESIFDKKYRIHDVSVGGQTIDIPNTALLGNDSTQMSTLDARYYLLVVRYLSKKLPADVRMAY